MKFIFLLLFSLNAFADDPFVGDFVMIAPNMPKFFYSGAYVVEKGLAPTYENHIKHKIEVSSARYADLGRLYRVSEIVTDDHGAVLAVLFPANLWQVEKLGGSGNDYQRATIRSLDFRELHAAPLKMLRGEANFEGNQFHVIATRYLRQALSTLDGMRIGDLVKYNLQNPPSRPTVGVIRFLFSDGRALIYPLSSFGDFRSLLSQNRTRNTFAEPGFGPEVVEVSKLQEYNGPAADVYWNPTSDYFQVQRPFVERVWHGITRRTSCEQEVGHVPPGSPTTSY